MVRKNRKHNIEKNIKKTEKERKKDKKDKKGRLASFELKRKLKEFSVLMLDETAGIMMSGRKRS